jgi:hypothetical protein
MPSSCSSLRLAARLTPVNAPSRDELVGVRARARHFSQVRDGVGGCTHAQTALCSPMLLVSSISSGKYSGCEQQVLVQRDGKVIFASDRFCSSSLPSSLNRKTLNAR